MSTHGEIWDQRFAEHGWPTVPDQFLVELADPLPLGKGLDLGAGPGRNSLWLASKGWDMTLVDASIVGLQQAEEAACALGTTITTVHADVTAWEFPQSEFDLVIVANLHPGADALADLLDRAAQALRPGGHLYVVGHHVNNLGHHGPPDASRLLTAERLRTALPVSLDLEMLDTRIRKADHGHGEDSSSDTVVLAWAAKSVPRAL